MPDRIRQKREKKNYKALKNKTNQPKRVGPPIRVLPRGANPEEEADAENWALGRDEDEEDTFIYKAASPPPETISLSPAYSPEPEPVRARSTQPRTTWSDDERDQRPRQNDRLASGRTEHPRDWAQPGSSRHSDRSGDWGDSRSSRQSSQSRWEDERSATEPDHRHARDGGRHRDWDDDRTRSKSQGRRDSGYARDDDFESRGSYRERRPSPDTPEPLFRSPSVSTSAGSQGHSRLGSSSSRQTLESDTSTVMPRFSRSSSAREVSALLEEDSPDPSPTERSRDSVSIRRGDPSPSMVSESIDGEVRTEVKVEDNQTIKQEIKQEEIELASGIPAETTYRQMYRDPEYRAAMGLPPHVPISMRQLDDQSSQQSVRSSSASSSQVVKDEPVERSVTDTSGSSSRALSPRNSPPRSRRRSPDRSEPDGTRRRSRSASPPRRASSSGSGAAPVLDQPSPKRQVSEAAIEPVVTVAVPKPAPPASHGFTFAVDSDSEGEEEMEMEPTAESQLQPQATVDSPACSDEMQVEAIVGASVNDPLTDPPSGSSSNVDTSEQSSLADETLQSCHADDDRQPALSQTPSPFLRPAVAAARATPSISATGSGPSPGQSHLSRPQPTGTRPGSMPAPGDRFHTGDPRQQPRQQHPHHAIFGQNQPQAAITNNQQPQHRPQQPFYPQQQMLYAQQHPFRPHQPHLHSQPSLHPQYATPMAPQRGQSNPFVNPFARQQPVLHHPPSSSRNPYQANPTSSAGRAAFIPPVVLTRAQVQAQKEAQAQTRKWAELAEAAPAGSERRAGLPLEVQAALEEKKRLARTQLEAKATRDPRARKALEKMTAVEVGGAD